MKSRDAEPNPRKEYVAPRIAHTEKLEARAVTCSKTSDTTCAAGPIQS